ncbi:hypothetical protein EI94DRAFT_672139 [Lactarius quietus]|nr:hypothetical protein EI94DRAFT_672139 [Lactarius quietus]
MHDAKQSGRGKKSVRRSTYQRTRTRTRRLQLQLWLRRIHVQSAALGLSLRGRRVGDPHPCDTRVGGRVRCAFAVVAALAVASVALVRRIFRGLGRRGVRCRRRGILIVDRLYYRIIRLGLLLLLLCLRRRLFLLLLLFLFLKNKQTISTSAM